MVTLIGSVRDGLWNGLCRVADFTVNIHGLIILHSNYTESIISVVHSYQEQ